VAFDDRIDALAGAGGRLVAGGDEPAQAIGAILPVMEGALDAVALDTAQGEVGAEVGTATVEDADRARGGAIGHQAAIEEVQSAGLAAQVGGSAHEEPGRRTGRKTIR
jgi:hypothetical protein